MTTEALRPFDPSTSPSTGSGCNSGRSSLRTQQSHPRGVPGAGDATIEVPEIATEAEALADPATIELTEQEAIDAAVEGLRELIEAKYHFCNRWDAMMGERLPAAIKRDQQQRLRYLAAIKKLQGLTWWDKQLGD